MKEKVLTGIENTNERIDRVKLLHSNLKKESKLIKDCNSRVEIENQFDLDPLQTESTWIKGSKKDIQTINDICKRLANDRYKKLDDDSCPMYSRHKAHLMIGLSRLIPAFIKHNELHLRTSVRRILLHILSTCSESDKAAADTTKNLIEIIDNRLDLSYVWGDLSPNGGTQGFYPIELLD